MNIMKRYLTEQEQTRMLQTCGKLRDVIARRDHAVMRTLIHSGFRITEFSLLTVATAKEALKSNYLFIPRASRKGKKQDLTKLVTHPLRESLSDLLNIRREMGYEDIGDAPLVMSRKGVRMTVRAYQQRVAYWTKQSGIPGKVSPHWLRHTRAMNIMRRSTSNDPRGIVQAELGHASISSTSIYTEISREHLEEQLAVIDGVKPTRKRDVKKLYEGRVAA